MRHLLVKINFYLLRYIFFVFAFLFKQKQKLSQIVFLVKKYGQKNKNAHNAA